MGKERRQPNIRTLAILGPKGSHSHGVFKDQFQDYGYVAHLVDAPPASNKFDELLRAASIEEPPAHCALLPFHNSSEKFFKQIPHLLIQHRLFVVDARRTPIRQFLLAKQGVKDLRKIKGVLSNSHCINQCMDWLLKNMPWAQLDDKPTTSAAAAIIVAESADASLAAIGSVDLASEYGLSVLQGDIQKPDNMTSFFVVSKRERALGGNPFVLYGFPVASADEKGRIIEIVQASSLQIRASWFVDGSGQQSYYMLQLLADSEPERMEAFERMARMRYALLHRFGALEKDLAKFTRKSA